MPENSYFSQLNRIAEALSAVKRYAGMSDDEAEAILKGCIWEED